MSYRRTRWNSIRAGELPSGKDCKISDIWRGRTSSSSSDMPRGALNGVPRPGCPSDSCGQESKQHDPIVMVANADPVGLGLVASLARPGGNITGRSDAHSELVAKRLELLRPPLTPTSDIAGGRIGTCCLSARAARGRDRVGAPPARDSARVSGRSWPG